MSDHLSSLYYDGSRRQSFGLGAEFDGAGIALWPHDGQAAAAMGRAVGLLEAADVPGVAVADRGQFAFNAGEKE